MENYHPIAQEQQLKNVTSFKMPRLDRTSNGWKRQPLGPSKDNAACVGPSSSSGSRQACGDQQSISKKEDWAGSNPDHVATVDGGSETLPIEEKSSQPAAEVEDIDADDRGNLILMSEYVNDIYDYLYELEEKQPISLNRFDDQLEVTPQMRAVLVDWINDMHYQLHLEIETFYLAVGIIDRYLQVVKSTTRKNFQLVGVAALFIATKYEELFPPSITDFVYIMENSCKAADIKKMEWQVLKAIDGNLSRPLPIHFLRRFAKAAKAKHEHYAMAKYLLELSSIDYELASFKPSKVAAASLSLSLRLLDGKPDMILGIFSDRHWTPTLVHYSRYSTINLRATERRLARLAREAPTATLKAIYTKFQSTAFLKIALRPELSSRLMGSIAGKR